MNPKLFFIAIVAFGFSGCTLSPFLDAAESGSKSYAVVKNSNSLGKVANAISTISDTRKIKAQTSDYFVHSVEKLITLQSLKDQKKLIEESLKTKVELAKNTRYKGFLEGASLIIVLIGLLVVLRFLINKIAPISKETVKKY